MSAREASYNPQQWHSMGATQNWTCFDTSRINYHKVSKKLCYLKLACCVPRFPHITLSLIHNRQCVAEKSHWDKPPMCTKKLCFSYILTFALAKRQSKTLRCSFHFALYLYYYLCQSKRKFRIRSRTFKALLFHVSMTWSQSKSNQLQLISKWYPVLQPHFNVVTQEEMLLWIVP